MNYKYFLVLFILPSLSISLFAQHQTYKGRYRLGEYGYYGNVEYTYLEKNDRRIFDGQFKFTTSSGNSFEGIFKNGVKEGEWNFFYDGNSIIINFKNGMRDGLFQIQHRRGVPYFNLMYKENKVIGSYKNYSYSSYNKSYEGQFDEDGNATGQWVIKRTESGILFTRILEFKKGVCYRDVETDESTGAKKVNSKYVDLAFIETFFKNYNPKTNESLIDGLFYVLRATDFLKIPYINDTEKNKFYYHGFDIGENYTRYSPFKTIENSYKNRAILEKKAKEEQLKLQKEKEEKEKIQQEIEKKKEIQREVYAFDATDYGRLLTQLRFSINENIDIEKVKRNIISNEIKKKAHSEILNKNIEGMPNATILRLPIEFKILSLDWSVSKYIYIIDNTKDRWLNSIKKENEVFNFNDGNRFTENIPIIIYQCGQLSIEKDDKNECFVVLKSGNKVLKKMKMITLNPSQKKIKNEVYFYIEEVSSKYAIDPMALTIEEIKKTTEERITPNWK
jgi:hypothetical protein